jgi:hypothetical protein
LAPRFLIAQANDWIAPSRLPSALKRAGAEVAVMCPRDRALWYSSFIDRRFALAPRAARSLIRRVSQPLRTVAPRAITKLTQQFRPIADRIAHPPESSSMLATSLVGAIGLWRPDFVVCADETVRRLAHRFVNRTHPASDSLEPEMFAMLRRSAGDPRHFSAVERRTRLLEIARAAGVRVAPSKAVGDASAAAEFAGEIGYPVVVKRDYSWGGLGVIVCHQPDDIAPAMSRLRAGSITLCRDADATAEPGGESADDPVYVVEKFIPGIDANYALAALEGKMLAGVGARVLQARGELMPSSVVSIGEFRELARIAAALVELLGYSGFAGCDFRISAESGMPYLLELNPRPVPTSHLGHHLGRELCAALVNALEGIEMPASVNSEDEAVIALFPHEWVRDPASDWLRAALHDTPADDPPLLRYLRSPAWLARAGVDRPARAARSLFRSRF